MMLQRILVVVIILFFSGAIAQEKDSLYKTKKIAASRDTIRLEKESLNSSFFELYDFNRKKIDSSFYQVNFKEGTLLLKDRLTISNDSLEVSYRKYPAYLTKVYSIYDRSLVLDNTVSLEKQYQFSTNPAKKITPFNGLTTAGSITRGLSIGNNQNTGLNSKLDLQITGTISDRVKLRASIQDSNIPLQNGGYSQKLNLYDNIFMELYNDKWSITAGDIFLENQKTEFLRFNKKIQGIATKFELGSESNKTTLLAAAGLVRGQYAKSSFTGVEGNQGPYKLKGVNGELFILVVSGSERVYVNGLLLKRGENNDYIIDYNAREIIFTSLFTITSEMRIVVEYQFSDRNYTRLITYAGATHENKKWNFGSYIFSENDIKNQLIQQNLTPEQTQVLVNAGDRTDLMVGPSAYLDSYSNNKVLYKKKIVNSVEIFEFSSDSNAELYNVRFNLVGANKGNYVLKTTSNLSRIYEYIAPINLIPQGNYEPIIQLVAPTKIQLASFFGKYKPTEKSFIDVEIAISNKDDNLFSSKDDTNNQGISTKINTLQRLYSKEWKIDAFANYQFIHKNFRAVERLNAIEFNRDWNLGLSNDGSQSLLVSGLNFNLSPKENRNSNGNIHYQFEKLDVSKSFSGNRQLLNGNFSLKNWKLKNESSYLKSEAVSRTSKFIRSQTQLVTHYGKNWLGGSFRLENNQEILKEIQKFTPLSQRFHESGVFVGRGDSTAVYIQIGMLKRANDSLQDNQLKRVNKSETYYIKSKLIQTTTSDLSVYSNYRILAYDNKSIASQTSLNSRVLYNQQFFHQFAQSTTAYETSSGTLPQQEFTYLEVAAGQGVYAWNDYNRNNIQELQEFEIATFIDQAKYIRVFLPNRIFIKTQQLKFSQSITINPSKWQSERNFKGILAHFYNQTSFLTDSKTRNQDNGFEFNPFKTNQEALSLSSSLRNNLFFNRGKQQHSVTYTFIKNEIKNLSTIGTQETQNVSHQLQYSHLYQKFWLFNATAKTVLSKAKLENFPDRNYRIGGYQLSPKISYLFSKNTSLDVTYDFQKKENHIGNLENLTQNRIGSSFSYSNGKKITLNGEVSFYQNKFKGNEFSPVGYQILEGLKNGQNMTWRILLQKNITEFLDVNLNYQGRKSENSPTIHTGNIQLRAYF